MTLLNTPDIADIDQSFDALVDGLSTEVAAAGESVVPQASSVEASADSRLGRRVVGGLVIGFVIVAALGFILMTVQAPDQAVAARLGVAAFFGAWTSPFLGLSIAVGYHVLSEERH